MPRWPKPSGRAAASGVAAAAVERNVRADVLELLATLRNALAGGFVPSNTENALLSSLVAPVVARPYSQLGAPARCFVDADGMPVREELDTDSPRANFDPELALDDIWLDFELHADAIADPGSVTFPEGEISPIVKPREFRRQPLR
jgi:hypothetical protein